MHYNLFRYSSLETGQYVSSDPIGLLGGFNPYGYVFNPTGWVDPLGLNTCYTQRLGDFGEEQVAQMLRDSGNYDDVFSVE